MSYASMTLDSQYFVSLVTFSSFCSFFIISVTACKINKKLYTKPEHKEFRIEMGTNGFS